MGSTDRAIITGFICRLCSHMSRYVIHVYSEAGRSMDLAEKINTYLPVKIAANDPLPKTVCINCIQRLDAHHELIQHFSCAQKKLSSDNEAQSSQGTVPETTLPSTSDSNDT